MGLDARTKLSFLQERLRSLRERLPRDHCHYGVIQVEGDVPLSWHEEPPSFYPFSYRAVRAFRVDIAESVTQLHYVFDHNNDESDHSLLVELEKEL